MGRKRKPESPAEPAECGEPVPPLRLEWRSPGELAENPRNWRRHPESQIAALSDVIAEVGWAGACLLNERTGRLVDGHARQKVALAQGATKIPVLVGSWTEEEERKILATLDPIAGMAEADPAILTALLAEVETESAAVRSLLDELAAENADPAETADEAEEPAEDVIPEKYQVLVECDDEPSQAALLEELEGRGLKVRSLLS